MPRMYIYTLRKPDGEVGYVLKPMDEDQATSQLVIHTSYSEHAAQQVQKTTSDSPLNFETDGEVTVENDPGITCSEEVTESPEEQANDEVELMSTGDTADSESGDACDSAMEDQPMQFTSCRSKGIQVIEQPELETVPLAPEGGGPVITPSGILAIPRDMWISFLPEEGRDRLLKSGWTDMVCKTYSRVNPYCVLTFKHSYMGKSVKRRQLYFWRAVALCKHTDCIQVEFIVREFPVPGDVPMHFQVKGSYNHKDGVIRRRHIKGEERERLFRTLKHLPPSAIKRNLISSADKNILNAGNHSSCPTLPILSRIACDGRKKEDRDSDMWRDLEAMSQEENTPIRMLCYKPFILAWHTRKQLEFLKTLRLRELYVGCTGDFVKEIFNLPVYYHALIVRPGGGKPEFPIAEMLTDCKRRSTLSSWFNSVYDDILEFASLDVRDGRTKLVVDGSDLLMDAASWALMGTSMKSYLVDHMAARKSTYPSVHVCAVQELHAAMEAVSLMPHTLEGKEAALKVIRALQMSGNLEEAVGIFKWASAVFNVRFVTQKVSVAIANLEKAISGVGSAGLMPEPHKHVKVVVPDVYKNADNAKNSPYYSTFEHAAQISGMQFQGVAHYENALHIPGFTEYLLKTHLAYFPMWSNGTPCSLVNCVTEKWFASVKTDALRRQKNLKPGRFFRLEVDLVAAIMKDAKKEQ